MAIICKIEKYLNFHLARHTFSTTVKLANGVPLETVSREASKMIQQVMKPEETDNYINHELLKKKRKRKRHYHHL